MHIKNEINKLNHRWEKLERKISCTDCIVQYGSETCRQPIILKENILAAMVIMHIECNVWIKVPALWVMSLISLICLSLSLISNTNFYLLCIPHKTSKWSLLTLFISFRILLFVKVTSHWKYQFRTPAIRLSDFPSMSTTYTHSNKDFSFTTRHCSWL